MASAIIRFAILFLVLFGFEAEYVKASYLKNFSSDNFVYYQKGFKEIKIVGLDENYSPEASALFEKYIEDSISLYDIEKFGKKLLELYANDGYLDAKIYYRMIENSVYLLFSQAERLYWDFFEPTKSPLDSLIGKEVSVVDFEEAIMETLFDYTHKGYFSASFSIDSLWINDDNRSVVVDVKFDLGNQNEIDEFIFIPKKFNNTQVIKISKSNEVKTVEQIEKSKERLNNSGYFAGDFNYELFIDQQFKFVAKMELEKSDISYALASLSSDYSGFSGFGDIFIFMPLAKPTSFRLEFNLTDKNAADVSFRHDRIIFYNRLISSGFYARLSDYDTTYFEIAAGAELYGHYKNGFYIKGLTEFAAIEDNSEKNILKFGIGLYNTGKKYRKFGFNDNHIDLYFKAGLLSSENMPNDYVREIDFSLYSGFLLYKTNPVLRLSYKSTNFSLTGYNKKMAVDTRILRGYMPFNINTSLVFNSSAEIRYPLNNSYIFPFADFLWYAQNPQDYTLVSGYGAGIYIDFSPGSVKISSGWSPQRPLYDPVIHFDFSYNF